MLFWWFKAYLLNQSICTHRQDDIQGNILNVIWYFNNTNQQHILSLKIMMRYQMRE